MGHEAKRKPGREVETWVRGKRRPGVDTTEQPKHALGPSRKQSDACTVVVSEETMM